MQNFSSKRLLKRHETQHAHETHHKTTHDTLNNKTTHEPNKTKHDTQSETHHIYMDARVQTITMRHATTRMPHNINDALT